MARPITRALVALLVLVAAVAVVGTPAASATPATTTTNVTLSGTSGEQQKVHLEAFCDECFPDAFFSCGGCEVAGGGKADVKTQVSWTAPLEVATTADPDELHQGQTTTVGNQLTPGAGTITIRYRIPYEIGLFGRNGDFPPGPDWSATSEYTLIDEFVVTTSAPCTPQLSGDGSATCHVTDTINLLPETCFFDLCPVDITVNLLVDHTFQVGESGIIAHRVTSVEPDTDLAFDGPSPASVDDPLTVPCDAAVGDDVTYGLSGFAYDPTVSVGGTAGLEFVIDGPGPANASPVLDILSGNVFSAATVPMTGSPATQSVLGDVLLDNVAPVVSAVVQSGTFVEGSDIGFSAVATDNCATLLDYEWSFSDGGTAFGNSAAHAFADDGDGYTGRVQVLDDAGNATLRDFDVEAIANADPSATAPPDAAADWGIPVSFHASAVDPGPADQPTLAFQWSFGDGSGAAGPDVTHAYADPGNYPVLVTVTDKDGGLGAASLSTVVSRRDTTLVYTGATQGLPNKYTTLSATLSDEHGDPVVGRAVVFTLGSQTVTGYADAAGNVSVSLRLRQHNGTYPLSASFAGDARYVGSTTPSASYLIGR